MTTVCDLEILYCCPVTVDITMLPGEQVVAEVEACTDKLLQAAIFTIGTEFTDKEKI